MQTPLHHAAIKGEKVQLFQCSPISLTLQMWFYYFGAIFYNFKMPLLLFCLLACFLYHLITTGNPEICEILLAAQASVDPIDESQKTPLLFAASKGHTKVRYCC